MPPRVQRLCVAGSGAKVRWCTSAASRTRSSTMPGCTRAALRRRIERDDAVHVLREVDDDRDVAALAGEARAGAARQDRRADVAARPDGGCHVVFVERNHDADGNLPIVRRVGRVERARAVVEAHFAADRLLQRALERFACREYVARMRMGTGKGLKRHGTPAGNYFQTASMASKRVFPILVMVCGRGTGVPLELAGLHVDPVGARSWALDGNASIVRGDHDARSRQRIAASRLRRARESAARRARARSRTQASPDSRLGLATRETRLRVIHRRAPGSAP